MIKVDYDKCCGCFACSNICQKNAIKMVQTKEGFFYPQINENLCVNCGLCENVCLLNNKKDASSQMPQVFAAMNKDDEQRKQSSSGGIFTLIAQVILNSGGVVYGAAFDDNFNVRHIEINDEAGLSKLRTSKYVQSLTGDTFSSVKRELEKGIRVFYTGTPCQIDALKLFLNKDYENLFCADIVCHGVPSELVWQKYLAFTGLKNISEIQFRNKDNGWLNYNFVIKTNDKNFSVKYNSNPYFKLFLNDFSLRKSCYNCPSKGFNRNSDITLADFWGINHLDAEMFDDKGTSLLLIHSEKGLSLLNDIKDKINIKRMSPNDAAILNPSISEKPAMPENREKFFAEIIKEKPCDFDKLAKKYCTQKVPVTAKIKGYAKRALKIFE
ncbi:MAG: Coenzyme F420 hydrogenase/dehydrogenase, beta subunit C-terminal domain [Acutalibacteraceae bacterium]